MAAPDEDLRNLPLLERKRRFVWSLAGSVHIGCDTWITSKPTAALCYRLACERNLEGIVATHRDGLYDTRKPQWVKIKNPAYSQVEGREELFEELRT